MRVIQSGEWQNHPQMRNYRAEWLSGLLVERAEWAEMMTPQHLRGQRINGPDYVWFRFWLPEPLQIVEKYFDDRGSAIGIYLPISDEIQVNRGIYRAQLLWLGLWLLPNGHLTVLGESLFDDALAAEVLAPPQVSWAEARIRELTAEIHRKRMPPSLIRNFSIEPIEGEVNEKRKP